MVTLTKYPMDTRQFLLISTSLMKEEYRNYLQLLVQLILLYAKYLTLSCRKCMNIYLVYLEVLPICLITRNKSWLISMVSNKIMLFLLSIKSQPDMMKVISLFPKRSIMPKSLKISNITMKKEDQY